MKSSNYFNDRNIENLEKIKTLRKDLPNFCTEFLIGIQTRTTTLTQLNYCYDLRIFFYFLFTEIDRFADKDKDNFTLDDLNKVSSTDIEMFMDFLSAYRYNGKLYQNTLKTKSRKLATIRTFFKYFYNKNKLEKDVASKIPMPKLHDKPIIRLDDDEVSGIIEVADNGDFLRGNEVAFHEKTRIRDVAILTLFLGTGIRISELVGINLNDIDFDSNAFNVTRKGGGQSILYFSQEVSDALKEYYDLRLDMEEDDVITGKPLFLSLQKKRICVRAVENLVKKYASIISPLKKITPHKLRSTYGTSLYRETKDIYVVAEVLGHKDINTTKKHYAAISEDIKKDAANRVSLRNNK